MPAAAGLIWLTLLVGVVAFAAQDVGLEGQLLLGVLGVLAAFALNLVNRAGFLRVFLILLIAFVSLRYFAWRTLETIPSPDSTGFIPGILLYLAELQGLWIYVLGVFVNIRPVERRIEPVAEDDPDLPTVDILIPTYNEPVDLLKVTVTAAMQVRYPADRLAVHLLDDGGTDQKCNDPDPAKAQAARRRAAALREMCEELGAVYLTRPRNVHAKAGNINAALPKTTGELILILDADHVPTQDILLNTVGPFAKDPDLFMVQTPHFFATPDPIERNLGTFHRMPGENEMFYSAVQKGLDAWNGAFFCGSAAVLRRRHLEEVGGIAGTSITEDAETALELHARGYKSIYLDRPMVAGLSPDTFGAFVTQRIRWAQGMVQILLLKNPLFKRGLNFAQRLCYLNSSTFWLFPFARLVFLIAPLFYLLFGLKVFDATMQEFFAFAVFHVACSLMLSNHLFGRHRWPFLSDLYELLQSMFTARALVDVVLHPRKPEFKVTPKAESVTRDFVSQLATPFYLILLLLLGASLIGAYRWYAFPLEREHLVIVLAWNIVNIGLVIAATGVMFERSVGKSIMTVRRSKPVNLLTLHGGAAAVLVEATPEGGVLELTGDTVAGFEPTLGNAVVQAALPGVEALRPLQVMVDEHDLVRGRSRLRFRFVPDTPEEEADIVRLCYGDSGTWEAFRNQRQGRRTIVGAYLSLVWMGLCRNAALLAAMARGELGGDALPARKTPEAAQLLRLPRN
ncbi:MAG TPA: UDP-forming cellulose synthase catalytic subunit [Azospirillaceae bacterium]|nr:UDP-forming cellulose synthase catalytic subunit [Azospirillaceae bacterium]